jgi:hypothetical protein
LSQIYTYKNIVGWGCGSSVTAPASKPEALSSNPSTKERKKEKGRKKGKA